FSQLCMCQSLIRFLYFFFFSSRRRHTRSKRDWSSDVCSSDLLSISFPHASGWEYMKDFVLPYVLDGPPSIIYLDSVNGAPLKPIKRTVNCSFVNSLIVFRTNGRSISG